MCEKTLKNMAEMNQIFRALGMEVLNEDNNVVNISAGIHKVDFKRYQTMIWALYYLMNTQHQSTQTAAPTARNEGADGMVVAPSTPPPPAGILPSAGNVDSSVYKFVLNYTQNDTLNLGLSRYGRNLDLESLYLIETFLVVVSSWL